MRVPPLTTLFTAVAVLGSLGIAAHARAADLGQCIPKAQLQSVLNQDNQYGMVAGNEYPSTKTGVDRVWGWVFTKNASGDTGYAIRLDGALGKPFTEGCIMKKFHDVVLDDARVPGVRSSVTIPFKATEGTMDFVCSHQPSNIFCGYHNDMLEDLDRAGEEVMYHALDSDGNLVTVVGGSSTDHDGAMNQTDLTTGIMTEPHIFGDVGYLPKGLQALPSQRMAQAGSKPEVN